MAILDVRSHVTRDADGRAWVLEANTKVIEIAMDRYAYGWSPEEIHFQHPHLSLAQIHSALSFYYDHQPEMDAEIERDLQEYKELRAKAEPSPFTRRMKAEARAE